MTELVWDGKYKDGKKVSPVRIALPFQTIETVNEKRKAGLQTDMFALAAASQSRESGWKNRLIWGDKKYVLPSLLPEFAGKESGRARYAVFRVGLAWRGSQSEQSAKPRTNANT